MEFITFLFYFSNKQGISLLYSSQVGFYFFFYLIFFLLDFI